MVQYSIKNSTTIILLRWKAIIEVFLAEDVNSLLTVRMMPRDVATQWNSTYEMLKFVLEYQQVINQITSNGSMKLKKFKLEDEDRAIAE
jgi:hypothetical protein